jgi:hypothetical protein
VLTWDNLQCRGFEGLSHCTMCNQESESVYHLFVDFPFSMDVWIRVKQSLILPGLWSGNTIPECFKNWKNLNTTIPISRPLFVGTLGWKGIVRFLRMGSHQSKRWLLCLYRH